MKKFIKMNAIVLLSIFFVLVMTIYFTMIMFKYPLVGLGVKEKGDHRVVERIYNNGWASSQLIEVGDIVVLVDGKNTEEHLTIKWFDRVEMANEVIILDKNLQLKKFTISYDYLDTKDILYSLLPFLFSLITILLSVFLYLKIKDENSAIILIYFLLSIGICYISAFVSARGDLLGRILNTITLPTTLILFSHFLKSYFLRYDLEFIKTRLLTVLYVLNLILLTRLVGNLFLHNQIFYVEKIQLTFFLLLICILFVHLIRFYFHYRNSEGRIVLKILFLTLILAFGPFIFFYVIPNIFFGNEIISAEIAAVFLIIIPIALVYLLLAERLFDIDFFFNRLRYYSFLAFLFTTLIVLLLSLFPQIELMSSLTLILWFTLFTCITLLLYVKEYLDYKLRHHLFSQKGDFETSLYSFFQKAKYETKVDSLIANLKNKISDVLMVDEVLNIEIVAEVGGKWIVEHRHTFSTFLVEDIEEVNWNNYAVGSLIEVMDRFAIVIGGDPNHKNILLFDMKKSKINLNIQEKIWLETLAYFSSILLENFQLIEDLFEKIESYKGERKLGESGYPLWLSRLMFALSEKERTNLSIDLHDSVLQDQLQLLREIEEITEQVTDPFVQEALFNLKERMLDNIHLVRETCNELQPPFLSELGVIQSIESLIDLTKLRCNFIVISELDSSIQNLDKEVELTLYRVVQELLNNAMKHSLASEVYVSLFRDNKDLKLVYKDDGKGFDITTLNDSFKTMGIFGMSARVESIGGTIAINTSPGHGMDVHIELKEVNSNND